MKFNHRTLALAVAGMLSLGSGLADSHMMSQVSKTTISGYVDTSAIWAIGSDGNGNFPGRTNDGAGRADGFNLNVVQLSLEKPLDESEWASGYRVDMWMGPDSQWLGNYGAGLASGDFSLKQAYVAVRAPVGNGLDLKLGVFDTIIGYEVANSPANPNFSRSYGFFIQPFQHTGVLASYQITDEISISGGVANTFASGINDRVDARGDYDGALGSESQKTYMASITYNIPEDLGFVGGGAIYAGFVDGLDGGPDERTNYYVGATIPTPVDGLALGIAFDYANDLSGLGYGLSNGTSELSGIQNKIGEHFPQRKMTDGDGNVSYVPNEEWGPDQQFDAYSIAGYLSYQVSEKLTFNGRIDYLNIELDTWSYALDAEGMRVPVLDAEGIAITDTYVETNGSRDVELLSLTGTFDYSLWENVLSRLEVRWDHSLDYDLFGGKDYDGSPDENDAVTIALNMIYQF